MSSFLKDSPLVFTVYQLVCHTISVFLLVLYFFPVIRKSSITDSLGVWKLLRGVVKSHRAENRVGIIGDFCVAV